MKMPLPEYLILLLAIPAVAAAANTPADLTVVEEKDGLPARIVFPEVTGKVSLMLSCFSQVQTNGRMKETGCYTKDQYDSPYAQAVLKAAKKARMTPAMVDGKAKKVYVQFRVEFIAEGEQRDVHLYLNPGYEENVAAYGYDHVGGQRVLAGKEAWQDVCPQRAKFAVWVRLFLGEDGQTQSPSVVHASGILPTQTCQEALKRSVLSAQYIPAYDEGMPVPSTYVEIFGN